MIVSLIGNLPLNFYKANYSSSHDGEGINAQPSLNLISGIQP